MVVEWIAYVVAAIVLLWAVASFTMAASGGQHAGLHELTIEPPAPAGDQAPAGEEPAEA